MQLNQITGPLEGILKYLLIGVLLGSALMFLFAGIINWEDWFLGTRLDGLPAGIFLALKGIAGLLLTYLIYRFPKRILEISTLAIAYCGFLFVNSAITIQKLSYGRQSFSSLLAVFLLVPFLLLVVHIVNRSIAGPGPDKPAG